MVRHRPVGGMLGPTSVEHQDRDLLATGRGVTGSTEPETTDVETFTRRVAARIARGRQQRDVGNAVPDGVERIRDRRQRYDFSSE